jgi:hypothetical protein
MKKTYTLAVILIMSLTVFSCGGNNQNPCTNCETDTTTVIDTLVPVDYIPGTDTPLAPVDSAMGPGVKVSH